MAVSPMVSFGCCTAVSGHRRKGAKSKSSNESSEEVTGDVQPLLLECLQGPQRDQVARGEDGRRSRVELKEQLGLDISPLAPEVAPHDEPLVDPDAAGR